MEIPGGHGPGPLRQALQGPGDHPGQGPSEEGRGQETHRRHQPQRSERQPLRPGQQQQAVSRALHRDEEGAAIAVDRPPPTGRKFLGGIGGSGEHLAPDHHDHVHPGGRRQLARQRPIRVLTTDEDRVSVAGRDLHTSPEDRRGLLARGELRGGRRRYPVPEFGRRQRRPEDPTTGVGRHEEVEPGLGSDVVEASLEIGGPQGPCNVFGGGGHLPLDQPQALLPQGGHGPGGVLEPRIGPVHGLAGGQQLLRQRRGHQGQDHDADEEQRETGPERQRRVVGTLIATSQVRRPLRLRVSASASGRLTLVDPVEDKGAFRDRMRALRGTIPPLERARLADLVEGNLFALPEVAASRTVLLFYSFGSEVATRGMASRALGGGKRLLLPYLEAGTMEAAEVRSHDELVPTGYGPREPARRVAVEPAEVDLVVTPGLAFDRRGHRLGYGGGHYDRFLGRLGPAAARVGIGFSLQLVERVPDEPGDQRVDLVVTDAEVIDCRP